MDIKGKRIKLLYQCKAENGKSCNLSDHDSIEFIAGAGTVPASLEQAILGMQPGDRRTIRIPAAEVGQLPFARTVETPPGISYDFGPGDGGDVAEFIPPRPKHSRPLIPAGVDLYLDVELVTVEDPSLK